MRVKHGIFLIVFILTSIATASAAYNVDIVSGIPPSPSGTWDTSGDPRIWTADSHDSQLYVEDLLDHLSMGNVQINTGVGGSQAGNINFHAPFSYSGIISRTLTLIAANDINVNSAVTGSNLNVVFNPGDTAVVNNGLNIAHLEIPQGTLALHSAATITGTTTISGSGTLRVGDGGTSGVLQTGTLTNNNVLVFDRTDTVTFPIDITGTGSLEQAGTGTTIITVPAGYTGRTTVSAGELRFNGVNTGTGAVTVSGGTLSGTGTIPGDVTVSNSPLSRIRGGSGPGNAGTLTITGPLAFSGTTSALDVTSDGAGLSRISHSGPLTAPSGMTVNLLETMPAGTYTLISDTGTLPATLPTLGTNLCGKTPVFAWVSGTGLVVTLYTLPAITGISPTSGTVAGGTEVTITGIGFADGATVTFGGKPATDVVVVNPSTITATTPSYADGPVDVVVTNPNTQYGTLTNGFFYWYDPPVVVKVEPPSAPASGGTWVTITGTGFRAPAFVVVGIYSIYGDVVNSSTFRFKTPESLPGTVDVTLYNPEGRRGTLTDGFTFGPSSVTAVSPGSGPTAGGTPVTLTGTGFTGATAVNFGGTPAASYTVDSIRRITAISPATVSGGPVDITVTTGGGTSPVSPSDLYIYIPPLVVTGVSPKVGPTAGGTGVTITGTGFTDAVAVYFGSTEVRFVVRSDTEINVNSPAGTAGTVDIIVANATGTSPVSPDDEFIYTDVPIVTGVSPNAGPVAGGTDVTITGYGFTRAIDVYFGSTAVRYAVRSDTGITAASPPGTSGTVDITVTYPGGTTATSPADRFTYFALPAVSSVSPPAGPTSGGTSVTITGTDFTGATAVSFGGTGAIITSNTGTVITATSPAGSVSTVDIMVTTPGGTSATSPADRFTYTDTPTTVPTTTPTTAPTTSPSTSPTTVPVTTVTTTSPDNSDDDSSGSSTGTAALSSVSGTETLPLMTVTVNIGGDSKAWQAVVTGTGLRDLIVTGTVQPGSGSNMTAPPGTIFQFFTLAPARYTSITKAVINFTVPQAWLDENHIAPGSIVLYHQVANGWEALPTTVVSTKDGTVFFSSQSTGFSLFAIAGTPADSVIVDLPRDSPERSIRIDEPPAPGAVATAPVTSRTTAPPAATPKPAAPSPLLNIVLVIAAIGVLSGGGVMARRWWVRRQNPVLFKEF